MTIEQNQTTPQHLYHHGLSILQSIFSPLLALTAALSLGAVILALAGYNPFSAYVAMLDGIVGSPRAFSEVLLKATPLIFIGIGLAVAFSCGVWNIGAESQFYAGAIAATWVGVNLGGLPPGIIIPLVFLAGFLGGGLLAIIPGWLKVRFMINEVVITIMLNYIMLGITSFLVTGPMQEVRRVFPQSDEIVEMARLVKIWPPTRLHIGFFIAIALAIVMTIVLYRTPLGYAIRTVGLSPSSARYSGINVNLNIIIAMLLSGGAAGLAGAVEISGLTWRLFATISPGYGFDGIAVALMAGNNPAGTILSGMLFGALRAGSELMQINARIPSVLFDIIQGMSVAFVIIFGMVRHRRMLRVKRQRRAATL